MSARRRGVKLAASALGLGHLPVAPGTWGSAGALVVFLLARQLPHPWPAAALAVLLATCLALGFAVCPSARDIYASPDPRPFVLDEVAGQWLVCLLFWPWGTWSTGVAAFVLFRVFDVLKPPPVCNAENLPGSLGVMADDLVAALYSAGLLWLAYLGGMRPLF